MSTKAQREYQANQREQFTANVLKLDERQRQLLLAYGHMLSIMDIARRIDRIENFHKHKARVEKMRATRERNRKKAEGKSEEVTSDA